MDDKKKILLGEEDIISKSNEDLYLNVSLNSTFSEIRNDKFENVFDVEKQFKKERNTSRDFRIYGIIDSTIIDCDNLKLSAYTSAYSGTGINSGTTYLSGFVKSFSASSLVYNGYNSYGKKRGKYLLELTGYTEDFVYLKIPSNNFNYKDQIFAQQLIFRDAEGNFVDYGTKTIDIDENGNAIEINNDFYFLYNKHWIKKDLSVVEEKQAKVFLSAITSPVTVSESNTGNTTFAIALDKPSPFGLEQVTLVNVASTLNQFLGEVNLIDQFSTSYTLPHTFSFAVGEQYKILNFNSNIDNIQEFNEDITVGLENFQLVQTASPLTHLIVVADSTPRNVSVFNFQNIYQNRNYFTGIVRRIGSFDYSYPMPAVFRNGLDYEGTPMEFYPADNFTLKITNIGQNTILPVNPNLGVTNEQIFYAGQQLSFNVNLQYENTERHSIKFYFKNNSTSTTSSIPYINAIQSGWTMNGIPIVDYYNTYKIDYENFLSCFKVLPVVSRPGQPNISGWKRKSYKVPFDIQEDLSGLTITITAKSPGTRLDIQPYGFTQDIFDPNNTLGLTAETIQDFVYSSQTPLKITLGANSLNNLEAQYRFEISKNGFETLDFTNFPVTSSLSGNVHYLASGYRNALRNINNTTGEIIYNHEGVTSNWSSTVSSGLYTAGDIYINGIVLLAKFYFDNTQNISTYLTGGGDLNSTRFTNQAGDFSADFLSSPISVIPETGQYYAPQSTSQIAYFGMRPAPYTIDPNLNYTRSFNFRTGDTAPYNTYYTDATTGTYAAWEWNTYWDFFSSGGTPGTNKTTSPRLSLKTYLQDGSTTYGITPQGLSGVSPVSTTEASYLNSLEPGFNFSSSLTWIKLSALTPGVNFEFNNFREMRYVSGPLSGTFFSDDTMRFVTTKPAQIAGVTINGANNFMGGYSVTRPSAPSIPSLRLVSFEQPLYVANSGVLNIKVSLDFPSVNGNESVIIQKLPSSSAILGIDYTENQTFPYVVNWAVGQKDKIISFNIIPMTFRNRNIQLQITSPVNALNGSYLSAISILT